MPIRPRCNGIKTSNYPEQKLLTELELLERLESHYNGRPAARIYLAPRCFIIPEFYQHALQGMLVSLEEKEEYEACARILKLLN
ncbi:MAG: hypothetical protein WAZ98_09975 [Cyclobacteriaceae bacterium]